jgi:hypothetical protein
MAGRRLPTLYVCTVCGRIRPAPGALPAERALALNAVVHANAYETSAGDEKRASRTRFDPHLLMHETRSQTSHR